MTLLPVQDAVSGWRLAPDAPTPAAWWPQELLSIAMLDEVTGLPPALTPLGSTTTPGVIARISETHAGLVGQPLQCFLPGFITTAPLQLALSGPGYLPVTLSTAFGAESGYPDAFTPIDLGVLALHRQPITISGRTVSHTGVVRTGTTISLDGVWHTLADLANPPAPPGLVSLAAPLYADRTTPATIAAQPMTATPQTKTLLRPGNAGDASVVLSDSLGLAIGGVIALDTQDPGRAEYLGITGIADLGSGPAFPSDVTLALPLARPHRRGATATPMTLGASGAANTISTAARTGDVTLLPVTTTGLSVPGTPVVIAGAGVPAEYNIATPVSAISDIQGYVTLPPVHRAAQLRLRAHHAAEPVDLIRDVMLPLGVNALTMDFVFP
jgi:hypothetical protein